MIRHEVTNENAAQLDPREEWLPELCEVNILVNLFRIRMQHEFTEVSDEIMRSYLKLYRNHDRLVNALNELPRELIDDERAVEARQYDRTCMWHHQDFPGETEGSWIWQEVDDDRKVLVHYRQLVTKRDFEEESSEMRHCVRSYFYDKGSWCFAITSLVEGGQQDNQIFRTTAEVSPHYNLTGDECVQLSIKQHLGYHNELPEELIGRALTSGLEFGAVKQKQE
jgi:hypothetical protein